MTWALLFALGCGGSARSAGTTSAEEAEQAPPPSAESEVVEVPVEGLPHKSAIEMLGISGPDKPWAEMTYEEREWYMVGKVQPIMREVFAKFDVKYEVFECEPCHGPDAKARKYKMPSTHLSAVPAFDSEDFQAMQGSRIGKFMRDEVTVTTAKLLGLDPYDPATGEGFSCHNCHPSE